MKVLNFKEQDDLLDYLVSELEKSENILLLVDKEIAKELAYEYEEEEFSFYYGVSIQSDVGEYYVGKLGKDYHFSIEPAKYEGRYLFSESDKFIAMEGLMNGDVMKAIEANEIEIVSFDEDNDESEDGDDCDEEDCEDCTYNELDEVYQDYIDEKIGLLLKYGMPICEARDILAKVLDFGMQDAMNSTLMVVRDTISEFIEE